MTRIGDRGRVKFVLVSNQPLMETRITELNLSLVVKINGLPDCPKFIAPSCARSRYAARNFCDCALGCRTNPREQSLSDRSESGSQISIHM